MEQDEVYALLENSPFFYGATPYMTTQAQTVPVIGGAYDGAQEWWTDDKTFFPSFPIATTTRTTTSRRSCWHPRQHLSAGVYNKSPT